MKLRKISYLFVAMYIFSITNLYSNGNSTIKEGILIGDNSYAIGSGSISTSKNGISIGSKAVATGGEEDKESILKKLKENEAKINEIEDLKLKKKENLDKLSDLKVKNKEILDAGKRVEELLKSKEKAKLIWQDKKNKYERELEESKNFFKEHQSKIDDLNSRLDGIARLKITNIKDIRNLDKSADEFKTMVENGTNLKLSKDFYKQYILNYYKSLGDVRKNKLFFELTNRNYKKTQGLDNDDVERLKQEQIDYYKDSSIVIPSSIKDHSKLFSYSDFTRSSSSDVLDYSSRDYSILGRYDLDEVTPNRKFLKLIYKEDNWNVLGRSIKTVFNIETDIVSEKQYSDWQAVKEPWKAKIKEYNRRLGDEFLGKIHDRTNGKSTILYDMATDMKFELVDLDYQICYYQGKYERTKDKKWLDKKKEALDKREYKLKNNEEIIKAKAKELGYKLDESSYMTYVIAKSVHEQWYKENISELENKNKLNVDKLTEELEDALGINKNAIKQKEKELDKLRKDSEKAKMTYDNLNPNSDDLILSKEYKKVKEEIENLNDEIAKADEKLKALEEALTLHDLKNLGSDNIAFGTEALAVGDNVLAFGKSVKVVGDNSIGFGSESVITGKNSILVGINALIKGNKSKVFGNDNSVYGDNNLSLGDNNKVGTKELKNDNNILIGNNITSNVSNAIVLGDFSTAIENALSIGSKGKERQIKFVKAGTEDTDVVNKKQMEDYVSSYLPKEKSADISSELDKKYIKNEDNSVKSNHIETSSISEDKLTKDLLGKINNKANVDGSNINDENKSKFRNNIDVYSKEEVNSLVNAAKVADGSITEDKLHNDLKDKINGKIDKDKVYTKEQTDGKITEGINKYKESIKDKYIENKDNAVKTNHIENESVTKEKLAKDLQNQIDAKVTKEELKEYAKKSELDNTYIKDEDSSVKLNHLDKEIKDIIEAKVSKSELEDKYYTKDKANEIFATKNELNSSIQSLDSKYLHDKDNSIKTNHISNESVTEDKLSSDLKTKLNNKIDSKNVFNKTEINNLLKENTEKLDKKYLHDKENVIKTKHISNESVTEDKLNNSLKGKINSKLSNVDNVIENRHIKDENISETKLDKSLKTKLNNKVDKQELINNYYNKKEVNDKFEKLLKSYTDDCIGSNVKEYIDENVSNLNSSIASVIAMNNIPQVSGDKYVSFGLGYGLNEKKSAFAVGLSGTIPNKMFVYKLSLASTLKGKISAGAGFNISLGQIDKKDNDLKEFKKALNELEKKSKYLEQKISEFRNLNYDIFTITGYESDGYILTDSQKERISSLLNYFKNKEIIIIGYTDLDGKDKYNLSLGIRRSNEVKKFLELNNIKVKQIKSSGFNTVVNNIEDKFNNRRVEILVK